MDFYESNLSDFFKACFYGDKTYVEKMLIEAQDKYKLMEKRETLMRFNALVCVVQGARMSVQGVDNKSADKVDRMGTLQLLIKNDANINAKDVAGYSVLFHCFTDYGDLTETRKLGVELMKAGADPNTQNRFGSTLLHENVAAQNYGNLEILFKHGQINKCNHCSQSGSIKNVCTKCCVAHYCDKKCQILNWESHRKVCKEDGKGNVEVEVKQLGDEEKPYYSIINFQKPPTRKSNGNTGNYKERSVFKVKIQVNLTSDTSKLPLLVYNRKRTFRRKIEPTDKIYEKIVQTIRKDGILKAKSFFCASIEKNGEFKVQADKMLPPERW